MDDSPPQHEIGLLRGVVQRTWQGDPVQAILQPVKTRPALSYSHSKNLACGHRLICELPKDLRDLEAFTDKIQNTMDDYGEYNVDYVTVYAGGLFYAYFRDKAAAMRFKLAW